MNYYHALPEWSLEYNTACFTPLWKEIVILQSDMIHVLAFKYKYQNFYDDNHDGHSDFSSNQKDDDGDT